MIRHNPIYKYAYDWRLEILQPRIAQPDNNTHKEDALESGIILHSTNKVKFISSAVSKSDIHNLKTDLRKARIIAQEENR